MRKHQALGGEAGVRFKAKGEGRRAKGEGRRARPETVRNPCNYWPMSSSTAGLPVSGK